MAARPKTRALSKCVIIHNQLLFSMHLIVCAFSLSPGKERSLSPTYSRSTIANGRDHYGSHNNLSNNAIGYLEDNGDADLDISSNEGSVKSYGRRPNMASSNPPNLNPIRRKFAFTLRVESLSLSFCILGIDVNSANLRRWIEENNVKMLEGAVIEGHGERIREKASAVIKEGENFKSQAYIEETVPQLMNKIQSIHAAVSVGDLISLQEGLEKKDYILSKDHLGMTPLHKVYNPVATQFSQRKLFKQICSQTRPPSWDTSMWCSISWRSFPKR